ncbi:venom allergen 3-like [Uranotaenia lowii]|uniref:venom allergen 3-like n=1 Tax=Uranotaenia lowii TaxID=190385 RepID=UPI002479B0CE|nr:venom allergen 3-like [Uranotaenia lowii]
MEFCLKAIEFCSRRSVLKFHSKMKLFLTICLLAVALPSFQATDYCDALLCRPGRPHVACNADPGFGNPTGQSITLDSAKQSLIVKLHNEMRNKIATGKQDYADGFYPTAARMTTIQWDDDLAFVAAANARKCVFGHDKCRNTPKFPASGQNIAYWGFSGGDLNVDETITKLVNMWYGEYKDANPEYTKQYPSGYSGPAIGHFTQIVQDLSDRVGCSLVQWTEDPWTKLYLVCNYARTNVIGQPVYTPGNVASSCTTGTNSDYPGLCSTKEVVQDYSL